MVLMSGCGGIRPFNWDWARWFTDNGYEAIVVDSFGPRHVDSVCTGGNPTPLKRAYDAYAALTYLRTRPEIDGARIGMIGWSHGGGAVLAADDEMFSKQQGVKPFKAAVALYPVCDSMPALGVAAPLLILLGGADDWTPRFRCEDGVDRLSRAGDQVSDYVYPSATHSFDNTENVGIVRIGAQVHNLSYDAASAKDAHARVAAFLAQALK